MIIQMMRNKMPKWKHWNSNEIWKSIITKILSQDYFISWKFSRKDKQLRQDCHYKLETCHHEEVSGAIALNTQRVCEETNWTKAFCAVLEFEYLMICDVSDMLICSMICSMISVVVLVCLFLWL